jgi:prepilin-type N-terminal cleavage/methylation domain-containing protein
MKKAFTMLELIFVIVIAGILSIAILPSFNRNTLQEAADQLVSHIRYTQHLAMMDDKFDTTNSEWYKERWTLRFKEDLLYSGGYVPNGTFTKIWSYTIYSDKSHDANPNLSEMARNPLNSNQYLSGGYNNTLHMNDQASMEELRIGEKYGISNVSFSGGCRSTALFVHFDYMGRPFNSFPTSSPYELPYTGYHKLLNSACTITFTDGTENLTIAIEPETGYTHIL